MRHQGYDSEDSIDTWTLTPEDHALVAGKSRVNRLGFAVLLLFFRAKGGFPEASEIHPSIVARVAEQLGTNNGPILDRLGTVEQANGTGLRSGSYSAFASRPWRTPKKWRRGCEITR